MIDGARPTYLFDLDGTLVDSLPGIGSALAEAFAAIGRTMPAANLRAAIGPPIPVIARRLDPSLTEAEAHAIEQAYRPLYDGLHWRDTALFDGVGETLEILHHAGHRLFVATNKPSIPAVKILSQLHLLEFFVEVASRDSASPPFPSKSAMLASLVARHALRRADTVMVGDTEEDAEAAQANQLPFVFAAYGYGSCAPACRRLRQFADLLHPQGYLT